MTNQGKLNFVKTFSVDKFKAAMQVKTIGIKENPKKPGSWFFVDEETGQLLGAVASKIQGNQANLTKPVISMVEPLNDDGTNVMVDGAKVQFPLLHNNNQVESTFTL